MFKERDLMLRVKRGGFQSKCHRTVQFRLNVACEPINDMLKQRSPKSPGLASDSMNDQPSDVESFQLERPKLAVSPKRSTPNDINNKNNMKNDKTSNSNDDDNDDNSRMKRSQAHALSFAPFSRHEVR